ncbi:hypothetical protein VTK26DRAFT_9506 [Humicola hyalothermophila]
MTYGPTIPIPIPVAVPFPPAATGSASPFHRPPSYSHSNSHLQPYPHSPSPLSSPSSSYSTTSPSSSETRTLLTFPTEGLPSPRVVPAASLRPFPVRYPDGAAPPAQTQVNRWLCCHCAEDGYKDPVGMVHYPQDVGGGLGNGMESGRSNGAGNGFGNVDSISGSHATSATATTTDSNDPLPNSSPPSSSSSPPPFAPPLPAPNPLSTCWRAACRHAKCLNCALFAGPLCGGRDPAAKLLIRTVGGLHASPRFVDPVYWECACGEWAANKFDSRCVLGLTACRGPACGFRWRAAAAARGGGGGGGIFGGVGFGDGGGGGGGGGGAGVLTGDSVVLNRYGQRLGTADQRVVVADGPWYWQRRALGDGRCAIVRGLRAAMKRTGEGAQFDARGGGEDGRRGSTMCELGRLWKDGEPVPHCPYRRPPPVDENDVEENYEYEVSYLAGMPMEPMEPTDKGKGIEQQQYGAPSSSPGFGSASSPAAAAAHTALVAFFPGWNHMQM